MTYPNLNKQILTVFEYMSNTLVKEGVRHLRSNKVNLQVAPMAVITLARIQFVGTVKISLQGDKVNLQDVAVIALCTLNATVFNY